MRELAEFRLTGPEVRVLARLVNRATLNVELRQAVCQTELERKALDWLGDRLHAATNPAITEASRG